MGALWYCKSIWIHLACWTVYVAHMGAEDVSSVSTTDLTMDILMKGAKPLNPDAYLCAEYPVEEEELYIYKFEALANASTAHHMLLYGCDGDSYRGGYTSGGSWACPPMCEGKQTIMFAWAKNAPPTVLPKDVGLRIGTTTTIKTIVVQVHYARAFQATEKPDHSGLRLFLTRTKPKYVAGVFLMLASHFQVPPHQSSYPVDMSCLFSEQKSIFPFAYRTHAHQLGSVITGYKYNGSYHEIGKGNPHWPQAFYPVKQKLEIKPGDLLAARCTYDSTNITRNVRVGKAISGSIVERATGNDEMCNFYIMFYTDSSIRDLSYACYNNHFPQVTGNNFPADVSVRLPHNATLEDEANGHHHHHHHGGMQDSRTPQPVETTQLPTTTVIDEGDNLQKVLSQNFNRKADHLIDKNPVLRTGIKTADLKTSFTKSHFQNNRKGMESNLNDRAQLENYKYGNYGSVNSRDLSFEKRLNHDYYDDFAAANRLRERGRYDPSEVELSRNRNKDFEAMNQQRNNPPQQLQHHQRPMNQQQQQQSSAINTNSEFGQGRTGGAQSQMLHTKSQPEAAAKSSQSQIHIEEKLVFNFSWPEQSLDIGQVGGLSTDKNGNLYIFHRASRIWGRSSFDLNNNFQYQNAPIMEDVIVILDPSGKLIRKFGSGMFFMPHGIHVDYENNIWVTDVALHQVFKFPSNESKPSLTLGKRFLHSADLSYFCKPTDVSVLSSGEFFVTDGYCNSRVMKFSPEGKLIKSWGDRSSYLGRVSKQNGFNIPHSITVSESDKQLCVADRENGRIQCFDLEGNFKGIIKHKQFGKRIYSIDYCPEHGGLLYAVNGPSFDGHEVIPVQGFTMSMKTGQLIDTWNVPSFLKNPHAVAVDPKSHSVYVGELDPRIVWKLTRMSDKEAEKTRAQYKHDHEDHHDGDNDDDDHHVGDNHKQINNEKKGGTSLQRSTTPSTTDLSSTTKLFPVNETDGDSSFVRKEKAFEADPQKVTVSIVIGCLLVIPVILILVVALLLRGHRSGKLNCFGSDKGRHKRVFNFQSLLGNSHKGFDPLSTEESDHDLDPDDSDHDEYTAPRKNKA